MVFVRLTSIGVFLNGVLNAIQKFTVRRGVLFSFLVLTPYFLTSPVETAADDDPTPSVIPVCAGVPGRFVLKWGSTGSRNGQFDIAQGVAVDSDANRRYPK